jgi:hypothetical protein
MIMDPTVNIGAFWYMIQEIFPENLLFLKGTYVIEQATMCVFICIHICKTFTALELANKPERLKPKLYLNGVLCLSFVKMIMNPYPTMHDISFTAFWLQMNLSLVSREIHSAIRFVFFCVVGFCLISSAVMWITWTQRFSGNANFFWF